MANPIAVTIVPSEVPPPACGECGRTEGLEVRPWGGAHGAGCGAGARTVRGGRFARHPRPGRRRAGRADKSVHRAARHRLLCSVIIRSVKEH